MITLDNTLKEQFELIHHRFETIGEKRYKGIQLYFSPLHEANILFIGINPGAGFFNYQKTNVKRLNPLKNFEYVGQEYYLATQTKRLFYQLKLENDFVKAVKINHFPWATRNVVDLNYLLEKYDEALKLYYLSKEFVLTTIKQVKPRLIVCEGKSAFDRLKAMLDVTVVEYNHNTYVAQNKNLVVIGYKRHLSYISDKNELKHKINTYYNNNL